MLICDHPDYVEACCGDDEVSFWDIPDQASVFGVTGAAGVELNALVADHERIRQQAATLRELMPANASRINEQHLTAVAELERKVKKILGNKVQLIP